MDLTAANEVGQILNSINDYTNIIVLLKKEKDKEFVKLYNLGIEEIKDLIKQISPNNFRKKSVCSDKEIDADYLYDFKAVYCGVDVYGLSCTVPVYIKIGIDKLTKNTILVVSLHDD